MAEAPANESLGGYDEEFVNSVEDDLQCAICQLPLKDPMLTKCGHRFCRQCLDEHFKSQHSAGGRFTCPVDRGNLIRNRDLLPDRATERKILSFSVRCPSEGCQWSGELRAKDVHLESCPFKVVSCTNTNCNETMTRNNLQAHATTTCPWRILQCCHCSVLYPVCKTEAHELDCKRKPLNCPKNCCAVVPREELLKHYEKDCPLTITSCPYYQMGCATKVQRKEIESHLQEAVRPHVDFAFAKLTSTQEELKRSQDLISKLNEKFKDLERQLKLFEAKFNDQQLIICRLSSNGHGEKVNALERKVGTFQTQLEKRAVELEDRVETVEMILKDDSNSSNGHGEKVNALERKVEKINALERKVGTFQTQLEKRAVELENRVETVEMILTDDSKKVDSLEKSFRLLQRPLNPMRRVEQKESTSMYKDFAIPPREEICVEIMPGVWKKEWKIQGFRGFLKRAEVEGYEVESNPFYLGKKGYKCKLYMGIYKSPHSLENFLKLHFVIMKSENDIILPWPFCNMLTYELIDQKQEPGIRCEDLIRAYRPYLKGKSRNKFLRPTLDENERWGNGLCHLPCLSDRDYLLNDTAIINVVVGPRCEDEK